MSLVVVVDYGMGNLRSVDKAIEHVLVDNQRVTISSDADEIAAADRVVFPGQGAARDCMKNLVERGLDQVVLQAAREKPFLGICMGMQVLLRHTQENDGIDCLNLYAGEVHAFADAGLREQMRDLKIPHMGWNEVAQKQSHPLWRDIKDNSRFYFVHSYYVDVEDADLVAGTTEYGIEFVSVIARENVFAVQFHPEKSAHDGLQLLKNFCRWNGEP